MRWELWVASLVGVLLGLWAFYGWAHARGEADCQARHEHAALRVTTQALNTAGKQNAADAMLGLNSTAAVQTVRTESQVRHERVATQPIAPPSVVAGVPDALVCPDYLADPWVRLLNGAGGDPAPAPGTGGAAGVPGRR